MQPESLFAAPPSRSVGRSLLVACVWSLVLVVLGAAIVGIAALIAGGVAWITYLINGSGTPTRAATATARTATVVVVLVAGVLLVWITAYASTGWGSRRRALLGAILGLIIGAGYVLLGSSGGLATGLVMGWSIVIPAERVGRIAARSGPLLLLALLAPPLSGMSTVMTVVAGLASPWIAATFVLIGDWIWTLVLRRLTAEEG